MFCPRCGSQIGQGLKFCKSCGLPVAQVSTYVATGGSGQLIQPPPIMMGPPPKPDFMTPKQQMTAIILIWAFAIPVFAFIFAMLDLDELIPIPPLTLPIGIILAVLRYKAQVRRRQYEEQYQRYMQQSQGYQQPWPPPAISEPSYQPALPSQPTNPLGKGSVIEDETKKLPENRR
jgi:hypothetical protein